jgi:CelD/BcsL family acetyltransferase involved in cellulose biosynthesis
MTGSEWLSEAADQPHTGAGGGRAGASDPVTLRVVSSLDGYEARWDEHVAASPLPSPFLRSWWLGAVAGPSACFALVLRGEMLLGGLALDRSSTGPLETLRLVGQGALAADHLDLVADPHHADEVERALATWLLRPGTRVLDFEGMAADGRLTRMLWARPGARRREVVPYITLHGSDDDYLAQRPGSLRSTIKRGDRRLLRAGYGYQVSTGGAVDGAIDTFLALHAARFGETSSLRASHDLLRRALVAGAAAGEVRIHELVRDGRVSACEVTFESCGRVSFYQSGRALDGEERSAGTVLKWWVLQAARRDGFEEYDLLRGDEGYKALWANAERDIVFAQIPIGALASIVCLTRAGTRWAKAALASLARRRQATPAS